MNPHLNPKATFMCQSLKTRPEHNPCFNHTELKKKNDRELSLSECQFCPCSISFLLALAVYGGLHLPLFSHPLPHVDASYRSVSSAPGESLAKQLIECVFVSCD